MSARRCVAAAMITVLAAGPAAAAERCFDCLRVGAATVKLPVPTGTPLAGYGHVARRLTVPDFFGRFPHAFWFKPHEGEHDPVTARALVLEGDDARVVWVAVDLVAVDQAFMDRVKRRIGDAGVPDATLIVSASHTHSGPGAFFDSVVLGAVSVDRPDADVRDALVGGVVEAVRRAEAAKSPAHAGILVAPGPALTTGRLGKPVDQTLAVVKIVTPAGTPIAVLWNYAIHGTMLGPRNLQLSGDVMGLAAHRIERELHVPALFVNGAVGDVSPARHGLAAAEAAGGELASAVIRGWMSAPTTPHARLRARTMTLKMHEPILSLRNCVRRWLPRGLTLSLARVFPPQTELVAAAVGGTAWVTIPGELQSELAASIKRGGAPPWERVLVAGLSNDYLGYFLTASDAAERSYVACASVYGPGAGQRVTRAAIGLLRALADDGRR